MLFYCLFESWPKKTQSIQICFIPVSSDSPMFGLAMSSLLVEVYVTGNNIMKLSFYTWRYEMCSGRRPYFTYVCDTPISLEFV